MPCRDDQPRIRHFNFAVNSVFNNITYQESENTPILPNEFLLMDGSPMLLMDGSFFLLLGT